MGTENVSLKEFVLRVAEEQNRAMDIKIKAVEESLRVSLMALERATTKAEQAHEKRLEFMNEFRSQLRDQATTFARASEVSTQFDHIEKRLDILDKQNNTRQGRDSGIEISWGVIVAAITILFAAVAIIVRVVKG
jgi:coenzyme F420-reducing hydrogenase alpha subunit